MKQKTVRSCIIDLPKEFIEYLKSDGVVLPSREEPDGEDDDSDDDTEVEVPHFPALEGQIKAAIERLGGAVFAKMNWTSPRDAAWVGFNGSLQCTSVDDILILLKSSVHVQEELREPFVVCEDQDEVPVEFHPILVLRAWTDINPSSEFRCFVSQKKLWGITQRDSSAYYEHIGREKEGIIQDIQDFFATVILDKFPLQHYAFDVFRPHMRRVVLLTFRPLDHPTDPILFTQEELDAAKESMDERLDFRYIQDNFGVQPKRTHHYGMPLDLIDLTSGNDPHKLIDLLQLRQEADTKESDDDDETSSLSDPSTEEDKASKLQ
ncbi:unnamed protein product [Darwinula stevensoni]|uniref:Cell division cycle protein 123 homolog n=1 Tax=Darwinula stevensoni TaxID=69355 RepID=A0A7R8XEN4_9CRUS|nr:unnamed protein product [Darwinula stevensoni]CAG0895924.1 unnamed protein product [Darwinula stevensoni]